MAGSQRTLAAVAPGAGMWIDGRGGGSIAGIEIARLRYSLSVAGGYSPRYIVQRGAVDVARSQTGASWAVAECTAQRMKRKYMGG